MEKFKINNRLKRKKKNFLNKKNHWQLKNKKNKIKIKFKLFSS